MKITFKTIGSDPEFFIRRKKDGIFVPSSLITNGTKTRPQETNTKGFLVHKDNLSVEGNIPPASDKKTFIENMKFLKDIINLMAQTKNCELVCADEAKFLPRFLQTTDAQEYGCSKDFNVWTNTERDTPKLGELDCRFSGFHIHLGYDYDPSYTKEFIVKALGRAFDIFLTWPSDEIKYTRGRRETYGVYGSVRYTKYGSEHRSLGSFFTQDKYLGLVYDQIEKLFTWINEGDNLEKIGNYSFKANFPSMLSVAEVMKDLDLMEYYNNVINKKIKQYA